jgi:hypothetical protein
MRFCCKMFTGAALALVLVAPPANAAPCPAYSEPAIVLRPLSAPLRRDETLSLAQLRRMAADGTGSEGDAALMDPSTRFASRHETPVGLTAARVRLDASFTMSSLVDPRDGSACVQFSRIDLFFGFDDRKVYLARELPPGTCSYATILDHESKHVATDEKILAALGPQLTDTLRAQVRSVGIMRARSSQEGEAKLKLMVQETLAGLGKKVTELRESEQQKIDSPEEYARLSASCEGDLARIIEEAQAASATN